VRQSVTLWWRRTSASSTPGPATWCKRVQAAKAHLVLEGGPSPNSNKFDLIIPFDDIHLCPTRIRLETGVLFELIRPALRIPQHRHRKPPTFSGPWI